DVFLASKTHDRTRDGSLRLLDDSLKRLRTDRLDLWQLHDLRTKADLDAVFGPDGALEALLQARADGRVRFLGITGHYDPEILVEAMRRFEFDAALIALNAADVHRLSFLQTAAAEAANREMGVIAMKVYSQGALLHRGRLGESLQGSGLTPDEALGYCLSQPQVSLAIIGCSTPAEVDDNVRIAREFAPLDESILRELENRTAANAAQYTAYKRLPFAPMEL
ncbi:MAG: aldo/keto reductase, partial [Planctomycetales bacterium]